MVFDNELSPNGELLEDVEAFIEEKYEFKCNPKYKGFFGRIRAYFDRLDAEEIANKSSGESWLNISETPTIYYSEPPSEEFLKREIEQHVAKQLEKSFSNQLIKLIEAKKKTPSEVYKKANIDRKLFSKIRSEKRYIPSKKTAIALAIALELNLEETQHLLSSAGFTLSRSLLFDVIIEYFISQNKYDVFEINDVLFSYNQQILGG